MLDRVQIVKGRNEILTASDGQEYVDLISGYGSILLGHCHQPIVDRVRRQLADVWSTSRLGVPALEEATSLVNSSLAQDPYRLVQFYSSGSEAIEFAMRIAAVTTRKTAFVGFSRGMHGKSIAASAMCWGSNFVDLPNFSTLPFVDSCSEAEILERLKRTLASCNVAAVFLEIIQGVNGGHEATPGFYRAAGDLCREQGSLCVVDEVLTGFYRSGSLRYSRDVGLSPDILVFGKALGNGFPISAVVCRDGIEITSAMLPGSTFSNNPLAASAVAGTLTEMARLDIRKKTEILHREIGSRLASLRDRGFHLRGRGALWILEVPGSISALTIQQAAFSANVLVSAHNQCIRLFPPATISLANLHRAIDVVSDACLAHA